MGIRPGVRHHNSEPECISLAYEKAVTDEELNQAVESEKSANTTTPNNSNNNKDVPEALRKYMH